MKTYKESEMTKGWFVGEFAPTALAAGECEVALKRYKSGDKEGEHYHLIATEVTLVVSGRVRMNGFEYDQGSIVVMEPGESTDFEALEDSVNVVVKVPCVKGDKYQGRKP
jgi:quercetin dioxygenase-like cupin family protein